MINKTTNYSMFKFIDGNRSLVDGHVKKLMASITKKNLLDTNPIVVNNFCFVIDGQHRLEAAKRLGLPIYYIVLDKGSLSDVWLFNSNQKNWSMADFVDSFCGRGYKDYQVLKKYSLDFGIQLVVSAVILSGGRYLTNINHTVKSGEWKVKSTIFAYKFGELFNQVRKYVDKGALSNRELLLAVISLYKNGEVNKSKLLAKMARRKIVIKRQPLKTDYLRIFEGIYNFKNKKPIRLF